MITPEQFLHDCCPERCGRLHGKRVTHWSSIEIACPNGDCMFFVEANSPGVPEVAAGSGLGGNALLEGKRRMRAKTFLSRIVIAQNIGDDCRCLFRSDAADRLMFRS